jgi:hypothetical protein
METLFHDISSYVSKISSNATTVVRFPDSLLPTVYQLLDQARQDVEDAAWLEEG